VRRGRWEGSEGAAGRPAAWDDKGRGVAQVGVVIGMEGPAVCSAGSEVLEGF
jgi:hypothetical protein